MGLALAEFKSTLCHRKSITLKDAIVKAWGSFSDGYGSIFNFLIQLLMNANDPVQVVSHREVIFKKVRAQIIAKRDLGLHH